MTARWGVYQHILIAVDESECSDAALAHGLALAKEQNAEVRVVHVLDTQVFDTYNGVNLAPMLATWRDAAQTVVDRSVRSARAAGLVRVSGASIEVVARRIADVLVADARNWGADLIVMGTHGRHGINRMFMGSVAEGVLHAAPAPVLLIRLA